MISIICVFNDKQILDSCLIASLVGQTAAHEVILLDNQKGRYVSAASALNEGARKAQGDLLVFCHQDIKFLRPDALDTIARFISLLGDTVVVGPAGKSSIPPYGTYTNMHHGIVYDRPAGDYPIQSYQEVDTLDECLFAMRREVFDDLQFDEVVCNGWHLYVVDYCLGVHTQLNSKVYAVDIPVQHVSEGSSMNASYFRILRNLGGKYAGTYAKVYTTMGDYSFSCIAYDQCKYTVKCVLKWLYFKVMGKRLTKWN